MKNVFAKLFIFALAVALAFAFTGCGKQSDDNGGADAAPVQDVSADDAAQQEEPPAPEEPDDGIVESGSCGDDAYFTLTSDGVLTISGTGAMRNCPDVTETVVSYFAAPDVKSVVIEEGITEIGQQSFRNYINLTEVSLPSTLVYIDNHAFNGTQIRKITIPEGVTTIGGYAFCSCEYLDTVELPSTLRMIEDCAFYGCNRLQEIKLPEGLTKLNPGVFRECSLLTTVYVPASLKAVDSGSFLDCYGITDVYYAGTPAQWQSINITEYDNETFLNATIHFS